jgi:hypothetical protein
MLIVTKSALLTLTTPPSLPGSARRKKIRRPLAKKREAGLTSYRERTLMDRAMQWVSLKSYYYSSPQSQAYQIPRLGSQSQALVMVST